MSELPPEETVTPEISRKYQVPISRERLDQYRKQVKVSPYSVVAFDLSVSRFIQVNSG